MANEIKSINGRKVCDEKAREDIASIVIPTNVSELTNDSGFITNSDIPTNVSELTNDAGFITALDVNVPTKTSELTNDSGFITADDIPSSSEIPATDAEIEEMLNSIFGN